MSRVIITPVLSERQLDDSKRLILEAVESDARTQAFDHAEKLMTAAPRQREAARLLVELVHSNCFSTNDNLKIVALLVQHYDRDLEVLLGLADSAEYFRDLRYLNDAPPSDEALVRLAHLLTNASDSSPDHERYLIDSCLAPLCKALGRAWDQLAEKTYLRLLRQKPERWQLHYNYGLFLKTRGRFEEGMHANLEAERLGGGDQESVLWNLGICATGAGNAEIALRVWKALDNKIELGRFDLPQGGYPAAKVHLAEHPLAERTTTQDSKGPGIQETIWVERLSPCHGIIRSVLYHNLGIDYGDVVLFDGAPITYQKYNGEEVPVFPHLATLIKRGYQLFNFAGTQTNEGEIAHLSDLLPLDTIVYCHTEQFLVVCRECWEHGNREHDHPEKEKHHVVFGQIAAPPEVSPRELLRALEEAVRFSKHVQLFIPDLREEAGEVEHARLDAARYETLFKSQENHP